MKKEQEFLTISNVSGELLDSADRTYKRIEASPLAGMMFNPAVGREMPVIDISIEPVTFNQHENPWDDGKADKLYNVAVGTILPGKIVKKAVPPYSFADANGEVVTREVRSLAVFGDTTDNATFNKTIISTFNKQKYFLLEDGTPDLIRSKANGINLDAVPSTKEEDVEEYVEEIPAES